jgi:hypothetical protein
MLLPPRQAEGLQAKTMPRTPALEHCVSKRHAPSTNSNENLPQRSGGYIVCFQIVEAILEVHVRSRSCLDVDQRSSQFNISPASLGFATETRQPGCFKSIVPKLKGPSPRTRLEFLLLAIRVLVEACEMSRWAWQPPFKCLSELPLPQQRA